MPAGQPMHAAGIYNYIVLCPYLIGQICLCIPSNNIRSQPPILMNSLPAAVHTVPELDRQQVALAS